MRAIAIINLKGGVGKTVTTIQLASILSSHYGQRVAVVDCDGQCNLTRFYLPDYRDGELPDVSDVMSGKGETVWEDNMQLVRPGVQLLPASSKLYRLDLAAMTKGHANITALRDFAEAMAEDGVIDTLIFDCPPGFTAASTAALMAAREVIVPVLVDGFSVEGMSEMMAQIHSMKQVNPDLRLAGVLITQWHKCPVVQQGEKMLRDTVYGEVFRTVIRRTDKVPESTFVKQPMMDYSWRSAATQDYIALVRELFGEAESNAV